MKLHEALLIDGKPMLGSYRGQGVEEPGLCKDIGMNLVTGGRWGFGLRFLDSYWNPLDGLTFAPQL